MGIKTAMDSLISRQQTEREAQREQLYREELVERLMRATQEENIVDPLEGVRFHRISSPVDSIPNLYEPALGVIAQGSKELSLGMDYYRYDAYHYCLGTVELPMVARIVEASRERPYLSLRLELDPVLIGSVMTELGHTDKPERKNIKAFDVSELDADLLETVVRLGRLVDSPTEAQVLLPLVKREIVCRLLLGNQGDRLRHIAVMSGYTSPIAKAIGLLRQEFDQQLRMEDIAQEIGLSLSSFHHQFKSVTALTPLQFQKRVRLQEARKLLLGEHLDATSTAFRVGYNDASHFNRDYKRHFGLPPMSDVERLRETAAHNNSLRPN